MHRKVLAVAAALFAGYLALTAWIVSQAIEYRKAPSTHAAFLIRSARGWFPHDAVATGVVLHEGSKAYRIQTRTELYDNVGRRRFSPWTALFLRQDFQHMSDDEFNLFVTSYPGDYRQVHARILANLTTLYAKVTEEWASENADTLEGPSRDEMRVKRLVHVLNRYPLGRAAFATWYENNIVRPKAVVPFTKLAGEICRFESVDYGPVFKSLLPSDEDERADLLTALAGCVPLKGRAGSSFSTQFQRLAQVNPARARSALPFVGRLLRPAGRALAAGEGEAVRKIVSTSRDCNVGRLFNAEYLADTSRDEDEPVEVRYETGPATRNDGTIFRIEDTEPLFKAAAARRDFCGQVFFGILAYHDVKLAERLFAPYKSGPDSGLRKDMIVHLVNNESEVGIRLIDQAFMGAAPRSAQFNRLMSYIENSKAAGAYKNLAMHDYLETGKRFPPVYVRRGDAASEVPRWRNFVTTYPWFPGADDAYYRLAYAAFADGDNAGAVATLKTYAALELPDQDAEPFMIELLGAIAEREAETATLAPDLEYDLMVLREYMAIPGSLALGEDGAFETCEARTRALRQVGWLAALQSAPDRPALGDEPRSESSDVATVCSALRAALWKNDAEEVANALDRAEVEVIAQLALPPDQQATALSEESLSHLTRLNGQVTALVDAIQADPDAQGVPAYTVGWVLFLDQLNRRYTFGCEKQAGAYCRSALQLGAVKARLTGEDRQPAQ